MSAFREALFANDALYFLTHTGTRTGQVLLRFTAEMTRPPWVAQAWRASEQEPWNTDFGGRWLETGAGKMIWQERES